MMILNPYSICRWIYEMIKTGPTQRKYFIPFTLNKSIGWSALQHTQNKTLSISFCSIWIPTKRWHRWKSFWNSYFDLKYSTCAFGYKTDSYTSSGGFGVDCNAQCKRVHLINFFSPVRAAFYSSFRLKINVCNWNKEQLRRGQRCTVWLMNSYYSNKITAE